MHSRKTLLLFVMCGCILVFNGCRGSRNNAANSTSSSAANQASDNANVPQTNQEELSLLINVPYETEDIAWKQDATKKRITAVLLFSSADANKIVADAEKIHPAEAVATRVQSWFPQELIAQSEMGGGEDEVRGQAYAADQFYQDPYTSGRIIRVENTDYFIVELSAK
jgi:hypothetical protein